MSKYDQYFQMGYNSYQKGSPYFCEVPKSVYKESGEHNESNFVLAYCQGYQAAQISKFR
jgi:hypothetical protein